MFKYTQGVLHNFTGVLNNFHWGVKHHNKMVQPAGVGLYPFTAHAQTDGGLQIELYLERFLPAFQQLAPIAC